MAKDALVQELVDGFDDWPAQPRLEEPASAGSCGGAARMTSELYPYDALFSPIRVNRLTLKNRIVMAPMGNIDMCEETGRPNQKMLDYFFARAKGGCGLITTGLVPVSHGIDATVTEPGGLTYFPRIDRSRTVMAGWRDLAQGVHAFGSRIFVQLTAGLGRVGNPQCLLTLKRFPASASVLPNYYMPSVPCMRLSDRRLGHIVRALGQAAADASAMGLDGVYLHGHEGYLLEQMANPAFNHRRLGRYADWRRFGLDAVREIRRRVGPDLPIMYRIDLSLALEETYGEKVLDGTYLGRMRGGRSVEQTLGYMEELVAAGVDLFDVDLGCYDNWWMPHPPASMPAGCFVPVAEAVKRRFARDGVKSNAGLPVPVVAVGKLGYPDVAERALREGTASLFVYPLRALIADQAFHLREALAPFGITVVTLTGESTVDERRQAFAGLADGSVDIALTTPEFLAWHADSFAYTGWAWRAPASARRTPPSAPRCAGWATPRCSRSPPRPTTSAPRRCAASCPSTHACSTPLIARTCAWTTAATCLAATTTWPTWWQPARRRWCS